MDDPLAKFIAYLNESRIGAIPPSLLLWGREGQFIAAVDMTGDSIWNLAIGDVDGRMRLRAARAVVKQTSAGAAALFGTSFRLIGLLPKPFLMASYETAAGHCETRAYKLKKTDDAVVVGSYETLPNHRTVGLFKP